MAAVEIREVRKAFGKSEVIHGVSVDIRDGEFSVLVGPSGCGKSTLLRMIAGLESITAGEIAIGGRIVNMIPPKERDTAMVFQNYALYPHMTVYENMAFSLKLRKAEKHLIDTRVRQVADILNLSELLYRYPRQLSGGQRQRVAMGRAIVRNPQVFLFDEPLSNLDAKLRVQMRAEIKELHQRLGTTAIHVTHDQIEAMTLGDRIVVMKDGVMQQCGAPLEAYHCPANRFVAGFVGTPPMNFFEGTLIRRNGSIWLDEGSAQLCLPDAHGERLRNWVDRPVTLGVRPEAMELRGEGRFAGENNVLTAQVSVVEPLGEKMDLYAATVRHPNIVARIDSRSDVQPGDQVALHLDMEKIHVFAPGPDGENLSAG